MIHGQKSLEMGRLAQRLKGIVDGMAALQFVPNDNVPKDWRKEITNTDLKRGPNRIHIIVSGNLINYPSDVGT
eukprot:CCRYP_004107-RA/>CCRYP_004107-RA protein AED:0.43 eAED:0.49 QI:0/0/0/1/0/0/2/0/72